MNSLQKVFDLKLKEVHEFLNAQKINYQADDPIWNLHHHFADGFYIRECTLPAGMLVHGKIHKQTHPVFLMKGHVIVATEEGIAEHIAPCFMIAPKDSPKIAYAVKDSHWINVHITDATTPEEAEHDLAWDWDRGEDKCL